jgi:uncharacterized repeat protein (TIGR01451 family)
VSGTFAPGGSITYTVTLPNGSTSTQLDNPGNEFADVLPSELMLVSANATSGSTTATVGTNTMRKVRCKTACILLVGHV